MVRSFFVIVSALALGLMTPAAIGGELALRTGEPIVNLAGRWAGDGRIVPAYGPSEHFKCVITYFPSQDGSQVKQNLRCRGASHHFDAATQLQIAGAEVTGNWVDNVYSQSGTVRGTLTDSGFDVLLSGRYFEARMLVVSSNCEQSVTVIPERKDELKELAAVVKKC